jgi:hypothetical protein
MLERMEKAGEIQSVERPSSQEEKNGAATVGQNQHTDGKEKNSTRKMAQRETNVLKIECCGSFGLLPTENENL